MRGASVPTRSVWLVVLNGLVAIDVIALLFAGIVHLIGANIEFGSLHFVEPPIIPAGVVETAAGLILLFVPSVRAALGRGDAVR